MTLQEVKTSTKAVLTPSDIAELCGFNPQSIRVQARTDPTMLGFPVIVIGSRVKIPRIAFLNFMEGRNEDEEDD